MLDFNKPMVVRGTKEKVRFLTKVNRDSQYDHLFVKTMAGDKEDVLWRTSEGKHQRGFEQYDVINEVVRREVHVTISKNGLSSIHNNGTRATALAAYGRAEMMVTDGYETITLVYEDDKLVDVTFIL